MIIGFDPGRDKCGIAIVDDQNKIIFAEVVDSSLAIATINNQILKQSPKLLVMGNKTTSKQWKEKLEANLTPALPIMLIDEHNSTVEARKRYWDIYPAKGLTRLIPKDWRSPPRPIDDIVAIILIERYKKKGVK